MVIHWKSPDLRLRILDSLCLSVYRVIGLQIVAYFRFMLFRIYTDNNPPTSAK